MCTPASRYDAVVLVFLLLKAVLLCVYWKTRGCCWHGSRMVFHALMPWCLGFLFFFGGDGAQKVKTKYEPKIVIVRKSDRRKSSSKASKNKGKKKKKKKKEERKQSSRHGKKNKGREVAGSEGEGRRSHSRSRKASSSKV